tara:strand:- start:6746 stop:8380 length:1635 start_codon:yes stop_codon:yes gene_type:complete
MTDESNVIVIGKVDDASGSRLLIQYEAQSGTRHEWVPRDAVKRQEPLSDGRTAFVLGYAETEAGEYEPDRQFVGAAMPMVTEENDIIVVSALENDEELPELAFDDSRPVFTQGADQEIPTIIAIGEDGEELPEDVWGGALLTGGRFETVCDWDFVPTVLPAYVPVQEESSETMMPRMQRVNDKKGEANVFLAFNPNYRSAREPAGAHLGTFSSRYFALDYPTVARPLLQRAAQNGWQASVLAYDRGKKMRIDCDVMGAMHAGGGGAGSHADLMRKGWTSMAQSDSGWLMEETMKDLQEQVHRVWRYGFSIHNSLDGNGSFRVQAVARRNACTNAGVIGGQRTLMSMRHTKGVMEPIDWDDFADTIDAVITDAQRGLGHVEALKYIPLEEHMFERLLTLCERAGLVSWPRQSKDGTLQGSHMWHLFGHGWTTPSESWVRVEGDSKKTLYHAYQVLTGAITHKPEWRTKGRVLKGHTVNLDTFDRRLAKVDALLTGLGVDTMQKYSSTLGHPIGLTDWDGLREFGVPALDDVPTATEVLRVLNNEE